jgi:GNAT superfamily N-acetyltransferase
MKRHIWAAAAEAERSAANDHELRDMAVGKSIMKLTVRPLTPDLWPAVVDLFGDSRVCSRCWCMYWRIGAAYRERPGKTNKAMFREVVKRGPPPGLLVFDGDMAVGWCQLTPRDQVPELDRAWRFKRVDDLPVWSLSCFYVRKGYRRRGITSVLISAALKAAKHGRAPVLEAYPLDRNLTPSATSTGISSTFERAGFKTVARRVPPRPIMRHDLKAMPRKPRGRPLAGRRQEAQTFL